jgi:hypothetical protein
VNKFFLQFSDILLLDFSLVPQLLEISVCCLDFCLFLLYGHAEFFLIFMELTHFAQSVVSLFGQIIELFLNLSLSPLIFLQFFLDFQNIFLKTFEC